jgi:Family of unknown function (DUF6263)
MKKIAVILVAIISIAGVQSCQSTRSATSSKMLRFNFEKGKGYDYEMIINIDQDMMGQTMQMDMTNYYSMDVVDDDGTTKIITTTYDRFKMNMKVGPMNIDVDSDKPLQEMGGDNAKQDPVKMLNSIFGAIKGRKFSMKVNAEGKVEEVTGFKDMAQSIVDSLHLGEKEKQQMIQQFSQQFNDQNIKDQFERVLYIFPNKEVKVGDSWQKTTTPGGVMGGKYTSTYTVSEIEGDMVTLEEKSKIDGASTAMNMKGNITGTLVIDSRSGLVVSADQDMDLKITTDGKEMKMKGKTKIKGKAR